MRTTTGTRFSGLDALAIWTLGAGLSGGRFGYMGPRFKTPEEEAAEKAAAGGGGGKGKTGKDDDDDDENKPTISQKKLNDVLASESKKAAAAHKKEIDDLLKAKGLTDAERKKLEKRSGELQDMLKTKEQQAEEERSNLLKKHEEELKAAKDEGELWKGEFKKTKVLTQISDAAVKFGAKRVHQIRDMLEHKCELHQKKDGAANPIAGEYEVLIPHEETDAKTKKTVKKMLTIEEKVKAMAASGPDEDGNLFDSKRRGGSGERPGSGGGGNSGKVETSATKIGRGLAARFAR